MSYKSSSYSELISYKQSTNSIINYLEDSKQYKLFLNNNGFDLSCIIFKNTQDATDFENNYKNSSNPPNLKPISKSPFDSKILENGKKLFRRVHGFSGNCINGQTTNLEFVIPYTNAKFSGADVIGCSYGDTLDFIVLDTASNDISGLDPSTFGANFKLNQFGFDVFLPDGTYSSTSNYDADVVGGMVLKCEYTNNSGNDKLIGINIKIHEVVD